MVIWCQRDTVWELPINMTSNLCTKKNTSNWWRCDTERLVVNASILFLVLNLACFDLVWWVEMTFQNYTVYIIYYNIISVSFNLFQKALDRSTLFSFILALHLFVGGQCWPSRRCVCQDRCSGYYLVFLKTWPDLWIYSRHKLIGWLDDQRENN